MSHKTTPKRKFTFHGHQHNAVAAVAPAASPLPEPVSLGILEKLIGKIFGKQEKK